MWKCENWHLRNTKFTDYNNFTLCPFVPPFVLFVVKNQSQTCIKSVASQKIK